MEALLEGQWEGLTKTAIAQALRGDTIALRICMDRIAPIRRGSVIEIPDFPRIAGVEDVPKAHAAIVAAVTAGIISAEEAAPVSSLLAAYVGSVDAVTFSQRLEALEQQFESAQANGSR